MFHPFLRFRSRVSWTFCLLGLAGVDINGQRVATLKAADSTGLQCTGAMWYHICIRVIYVYDLQVAVKHVRNVLQKTLAALCHGLPNSGNMPFLRPKKAGRYGRYENSGEDCNFTYCHCFGFANFERPETTSESMFF